MSAAQFIPYSSTSSFSKLVIDYLSGKETLKAHFDFSPNLEGIKHALAEREKHSIDRITLVNVLNEQYAQTNTHESVKANIESLLKENTFTICTAHQPNLGTGYLYFIYKIIQAIKLSQELNQTHTNYHFVPVYYMGAEDHDIDEIGSFNFGEKKYQWAGEGTKNAIGRIRTKSLKPLLDKLFEDRHFQGAYEDELKKILVEAYENHATIELATHSLVNRLFEKWGLVILNPFHADLKRLFIPIVEKELLESSSEKIVAKTQASLNQKGYAPQTVSRAINLFYFTENARERIEKSGENEWVVLNTSIRWNREELLSELHLHPERFSPNVILRPLFQETILPNVAFIGGGSEVAYWLELKVLFEAHQVFFPCVLLRQSVLLIHQAAHKIIQQLALSNEELFLSEEVLIQKIIQKEVAEDWTTQEETAQLQPLLQALAQKVEKIDVTLKPSVEAAFKKIEHQMVRLQKKMYRAEKQKNKVQIERLERLRQSLFPKNNLQERAENMMPYFLQLGDTFFEQLLEVIPPISTNFAIVNI